jgi:OOP family OmpA-OmpF porin
MWLLSLLFASTAHAADGVASGGVAPELNVGVFRPSTDSLSFFRLTDSAVAPAGAWGWRATTSWSKDPLVWADFFGEEEPVVGNLVQSDLVGAYSFGRARLAVDVPVVLRSAGGTAPDATGLGDVVLDGKLRLVDAGVGLAASARALLPTSTMGAPLAGPLGGEVELVVDRTVAERLHTALAVGAVLRGGQDMENVNWGNQLHLGLGAAYAWTDRVGVVAELDLNPVLASLDVPEGRPSELLLGANLRAGNLLLRPAVATGITDAVGTPAWRLIFAVSNVPAAGPADRDGDGLADDGDACPDAPEDIDTWNDTDGCPELTDVTVRVVDTDGQPVDAGTWTAGGRSGTAGVSAQWPAGPVELTVDAAIPVAGAAPRARTVTQAVSVTNGPPVELVVTVPAPRGSLVVQIVDAKGQAVPGAVWAAAGPTPLQGQPAGTYALRPGAYVLSASAAGFRPATMAADVALDGAVTMTLQLEPAKAALSGEKIDIRDSVYFETNKAIIKSESFALLDEVADILKAHPELTRISIEGHTDTRGDNAANKRLSQGRAEAVMRYLVDKGVAADRLEARGYGEEKPLVKEKTDADRARNRRVDFRVTARSDGDTGAAPKPIETRGDSPKAQ